MLTVIHIPRQLFGWRFVLIKRGEKGPFEPGWQKDANYPHNDPRLVSWLRQGENYGVLGDDHRFTIDADTPKIQNKVEDALPETFTVRSGGGTGRHYYYRGEITSPYRVTDPALPPGKDNIGEIAGNGRQIVGPGSLHPSGNTYQVMNDAYPAKIGDADNALFNALGELLQRKTVLRTNDFVFEVLKPPRHLQSLDIRDVMDISGLHRAGINVQGPHPMHGSTTGNNFTVNLTKNVWHCHRCHSGGGAWEWLAVEGGIIGCGEAGKGVLRGEKWFAVQKYAEQKGLIKKIDITIANTDRG